MDQHASLIEPLTARELKILQLIGEGQSYGEIGRALFIEKATVTWYVQKIYDKLGLEKSQRNHQKALACARALGLFECKSAATDHAQAAPTHKNPYKGLRSFQQGEAAEFFGREELIQRLLDRLAEDGPMSRFLAVVGPSGCGKSSVLHAGLIPALQHGGIAGSEQWVIASMVPGSHPLDALEATLARAAARPGVDIMAQLTRDGRGLQRLVEMLLPENSELLLVVDQFEEVFSLVVDEDQRSQFLALLGSSVNQLRSRVRVVIALRADYYDRPLMSPAISELFRTRTVVVVPLTQEELAQAICLPAQQAGVRIESELVTALVNEVSERPGLLPLMQFTLTELFDRHQGDILTLAAYHQIGGIRGALTRRADSLYESFDISQQAILRQIFLRLVKLGGEGEVLRRRVSRPELQAIDMNPKIVDELIDELANHRLITLDYDPTSGYAVVEVAHEALIRGWTKLQAWVDDSREDLRQQRLLASAASDWREANRDPSYLLSGTHLVQFQTWAKDSPVELGPIESEFLLVSINEKRRHDRKSKLIRNLVFGVVAFVAIIMSALAFIALDRAQQAQDAQTRAERRTLENRNIQLANYARAAYTEGRTDLAILLAMEAIHMDDPPVLVEQAFRTIAQGSGIRAVLSTGVTPINALAISPDGKRVISGSCGVVNPDMTCLRGRLTLWNIDGDASDLLQTDRIIRVESTELKGLVNDISFNPAGYVEGRLTALSAGEDGNIILWDVSSLSSDSILKRYEGHAGSVYEVAFSPDGKQFIAAYEQGTIILWETASGTEIRRISVGEEPVTSVAFSHDGREVLSASKYGKTILWNAETGEEIRQYTSTQGIWVYRVAFGPVNQSGRVSVWGLCSDNSVNVWDLETGQVIFSTPPGSNPYQDIQFTTDGGMTALALEGMIILKDTEQGRDIQRLLQISRDAYSTVTGLAISKDGTHLVSGDNNGGLNLWNLTSQENVKAITVTAVSSMGNTIWLPGGDNIVTTNGTSDPISPTLYRIDLRYGSKVVYQSPQLPNHLASSGLAVDLDGNLILAGGGNLSPMESNTSDRPFLWLIDARTGEVKHRLEGHQYNVKAVAFSPDGQYAISGSSSKVQEPHDYSLGELFLWSTSTGQIVRQFTLANDIQGISFSHSGKLIVTCTPVGFYANVSIWDVSTGERKHRYQFGCHEAVFSQDDVSILIDAITSSSLNRIYQINVADGKVLRTFSGLDNTVYTFEISPNYQYLLAASLTNVILWDMLTGRELGRIDLPIPGATTQVTFSTNSKDAYIVQDNANKIFTWHVGEQSTLEQLQIRILKNYYLRPFTCDERELYKDVLPLCSESESEK